MTQSHYPVPSNDDVFEDLCLDLFREVLKRPGLDRYARSGFKQSGIDLLDLHGETPLIAVQCKKRLATSRFTVADLEAEVAQAKTYDPPIDEYHVVTSARSNTEVLGAVLRINQAHKKQGLFVVTVWFWDKVEREIGKHLSIVARYFPGGAEGAAFVVQQLLPQVRLAVEVGPGLEAEVVHAKALLSEGKAEACLESLKRYRQRAWDELPAPARSRVFTLEASAYQLAYDTPRCLEALFEAYRLSPDEPTTRRNLVMARRLAGDESKAQEEAARLAADLPHFSWSHALVIELAETAAARDAAVACVPQHLRRHPDVLLAVVKNWRTQDDKERRHQDARDAVEANPQDAETLCAAGDALVLPEGQRITFASGDARPLDDQTVAEGLGLYSLALDILGPLSPQVRAVAHLARAEALRLLGRFEEAEKDIRAAYQASPAFPRARLSLAWILHGERRWDETLDLLGDGRGQPTEEVAVLKALALRGRRRPRDEEEALRLVSPFAEDSLSSLRLAVDLCCGSTKTTEGLGLVERARVDDREKHVLRALLQLAAGDKEAALREAQAAQGGLAALSRSEWLSLGRVFAGIGCFGEATDALSRAVFPGNDPHTGLFLDCAFQAGRHGVVARFGADERRRGFWRPEVVKRELRSLAEFDQPTALEVASEAARRHPEDDDLSLLAVQSAVVLGREEAAAAFVPHLPGPDTDDADRGAVVVMCLVALGKKEEAIAYGYDLARRHRRSQAAAQAFLEAMVAREDKTTTPERDEVALGCAVEVTDGDDRAWWVLEASNDACIEDQDLSPAHPLAKALLGKRVGDVIQLERGARRTISAIVDKRAFLLRRDVQTADMRFPETTHVQTFRLPKVEGEMSLEPIFAMLRQRAERGTKIVEAYMEQPIPLALFASIAGVDVLDAVASLAVDPKAKVFGWAGSSAALPAMRQGLRDATELVVDLSALGTLRALGLLHLVHSFRHRLVLPQASAAVLATRLRDLTSEHHQRAGHLGWDGERPVLVEETDASREAAAREAADLRALLRSALIEGCSALADKDDSRLQAERFYSRASLEAAHLAARPGRMLWSDEGRSSDWNGAAPRPPTAFTQVVLAELYRDGRLAAADFLVASAKLVAFGYLFPLLDAPILKACGELGGWDVRSAPLRGAVDLLSSGRWSPAKSASLGAGFVRAAYLAGPSLEEGASLQRVLLDAFASGPDAGAIESSFRAWLLGELSVSLAAHERALAVFQPLAAKSDSQGP